jgi:hypothetical protein
VSCCLAVLACLILCVSVVDYHVCHNDCQLFVGEVADAKFCRVCNSPRLVNGKPKVFRYLPLTPQLQQLFATADLAQWVRWAGEHKPPADGSVRDLSESLAFQTLAKDSGRFDDIRTLHLILSADGISPFKKSAKSCCPFVVQLANVSPLIRGLAALIFLVGIARCSPKSTNAYLQPLMDELAVLSSQGIRTFDAFSRTFFTLRAHLLMGIADYPGSSKLLCMMGSGTPRGCLKCEMVGSLR